MSRPTLETAPRAPADTVLIARAIAVAALLSLLLAPAPAQSHDGTGLGGGFAAGFQHPLLGLDHMLAMVAVGVWGAFLGRPLVIALPVVFPMAMALGAAAGMLALPAPPVELGVAASVLMLGLMILLAVRASVPVACALVGLFALFHGYAHGTELPSAADPVGYTTGFILCTGLLHVAGIAIGMLKRVPAGTAALRTAGGVIASFGAWFVAGTLAS
jgi:urease accessory protein